MPEVEITRIAKADLKHISSWYVDNLGKDTAKKVFTSLREDISRLGDFPKMGAIVADEFLAVRGYRILISKKFAVVYRLELNKVVVVHVLDCERDYLFLLKGELLIDSLSCSERNLQDSKFFKEQRELPEDLHLQMCQQPAQGLLVHQARDYHDRPSAGS